MNWFNFIPFELISAIMIAPMEMSCSSLTIRSASRMAGPGIVTNVIRLAQEETFPGPKAI